MRTLPLGKVYGLLEPGPVVLLSTAHAGERDVMTMSWHTMLEFEPPLIGCVVSDGNHSHRLLLKSGECVINIPSAEIADKVVACGNCSGAKVDKFSKFGLATRAAKRVGAPLLTDCFAHIECRIADRKLVKQYGFFVLEAVHAWITPAARTARTLHHRGHGQFMVAGEQVKLHSRMK